MLAIFFVNFAFAEKVDFSLYENEKNYLDISKIEVSNENIVSGDFVAPVQNFKQEELEKFLVQKTKNTWTYIVKRGESLWSISKKFKVPIKDILIFNNLKENSVLKAGDKIVIPGIKPQAVTAPYFVKKFANKFVAAFQEVRGLIIPVSGFNWGKRHEQNGTDIATPCGNSVYAAKDGIVVESSDGWNSGYGNYIIIQHQNFYTLYGHLSLRLVETGNYVKKGELIGYVGNTGYTLGPTGCHLHFEVRGRSNPLLE